jgi:hypothetical protein
MEVLQSVSRAKLTQIETLIREEVFDKEVFVQLIYGIYSARKTAVRMFIL